MGTLLLACCSFLPRESCSSPASQPVFIFILLSLARVLLGLGTLDISASVGASSQWLLRFMVCVHVQPEPTATVVAGRNCCGHVQPAGGPMCRPEDS